MKLFLKNKLALLLVSQVLFSGFTFVPASAEQQVPASPQDSPTITVTKNEPQETIVVSSDNTGCAPVDPSGEIRFEVLLNFDCFRSVTLALPVAAPKVAVAEPTATPRISVAQESIISIRILIPEPSDSQPDAVLLSTSQIIVSEKIAPTQVIVILQQAKTNVIKFSPSLSLIQVFRC